MATFTYEQDGEVRRTSGTFFRGENVNFHPSNKTFKNPEFLTEYVMKGWAPKEKFVTRQTPVVAFGSCFAANISNYLHGRGYNVITKRESKAYITQMGDGIVNTFAILQQFEWAWLNKTPSSDLWHGYKAEEFGYDESVRLETKALLDEAELFVITLGLSEIWYDEVSGEVFWRAVPKDAYDAGRHKFRVATHAETLANLERIRALIRDFRPDAHILFSVSPIPLTATFRDVSCITADAVSKGILRGALDEFLRANKSDERLHYMPSYEAVKRLFSNQWTTDRKHVYPHVLGFNMKMFEAYFCVDGIGVETADEAFRAALVEDARIGMDGHKNDDKSFEEIRAAKIEARKQAKREARIEERRLARIVERDARIAEKEKAEALEATRDKFNLRAKAATLWAALVLKAVVAILAIEGALSFAEVFGLAD